MRPTLMPGDHVLVDPRAYEIHDPRPDDIVVARHPYEDRLMIKRVSDVDENGIMLRGDNPSESTDGRTYGRVPQNGLLGRVACRLS
jgi:nickel-type superoxide dismutase maturation protease